MIIEKGDGQVSDLQGIMPAEFYQKLYYKKVFPDFDYNLPILPSWNDSTKRSDGIPSMSLEYKGHTLKLFLTIMMKINVIRIPRDFPVKSIVFS